MRVASSLHHGIIVSFSASLMKQYLLQLMTTKNDLRTCLISTIHEDMKDMEVMKE